MSKIDKANVLPLRCWCKQNMEMNYMKFKKDWLMIDVCLKGWFAVNKQRWPDFKVYNKPWKLFGV